MITKQQAGTLRNFYHVSILDSRGRPVTIRASGRLKTWKRDPNRWQLPVKHGLYHSFYLTPDNAHEWTTEPRTDKKLDPRWLTSSVLDVAKGIRESGRHELLPVLGDALQDAGCTDEDMLNHCYLGKPRVHGNSRQMSSWVLNHILGDNEYITGRSNEGPQPHSTL